MVLVRKFGRELSSVIRISGVTCFIEYLIQILLNFPRVVRTKSLAPADTGMVNRNCTFKVFGRSISLDGALFGGAREIYGRKVYFVLSGFSLKPTDIVIDLGANAGVFTTLAALLAKQVIAVEAQSKFIHELYYNAVNNNCSNRVFIEFGIVGPCTGLFSNGSNLEGALHFGEKPPVISMSDLIARYSLETVNFLKIDIEGSEFDLFNGEIDWLSHIEKIAMEVHLEFGDVRTLVEILEASGFSIWLVDNDQNIVDSIQGKCGYLFAKRKPSANVAQSCYA